MTQIETGPFASWTKPQWDDCFMGIAYLVAMMSPDHNTKHGAVLVGNHKRVVSLGFNGYPPDCPDGLMPKARNDKYDVTEHAEANCLNQAHCDTEGMTLYVTGYPCMKCFRTIACRRIGAVIYDPTIETTCVTEHDYKMIELMNRQVGSPFVEMPVKVGLIPFKGNFATCMDRAKEYYCIKQELKAKK